jgi:hypothetical protein
MQSATTTKLSLRLPIDEVAPICERAQLSNRALFSYVAGTIESRHLSLNAMSFDLPLSCKHLRLTLTLPIRDALRLHRQAQAARLSSAEWITALLAQGPLNVLPTREPRKAPAREP